MWGELRPRRLDVRTKIRGLSFDGAKPSIVMLDVVEARGVLNISVIVVLLFGHSDDGCDQQHQFFLATFSMCIPKNSRAKPNARRLES